MSFFRNDAINRVNLQSGVQAFAQGAGQIFLLVFLLRAGVSVPQALLAQAFIVAGRFALRPVMLPLAVRFGLKPLLIAGTLAMSVQYPLIAEVKGVGSWLVAACVAAAAGELVYYVSYNAYFAAVGDVEHRGHQIAIGQALAAAASIAAPVAGAWSLLTLGPRRTFAAVALVQALSVAPLLALPNVAVAKSAPGAWRAARLPFLLIVADGWFDAVFVYVWQIGLFLTLAESYAGYGGAMAAAGVVGALAGLLIGRHVDRGSGRRAAAIGYGAAAIVALVRAGSLGAPWLAAIANAAGGLVMPLLVPPLAAATHNVAKASPCPFRVKMATEGGWDIGCFIACVAAAGLSALRAPSWIALVFALPPLAGGLSLLWRYYANPRLGPQELDR
jgi:DHA1 family inner membrane transport protein